MLLEHIFPEHLFCVAGLLVQAVGSDGQAIVAFLDPLAGSAGVGWGKASTGVGYDWRGGENGVRRRQQGTDGSKETH